TRPGAWSASDASTPRRKKPRRLLRSEVITKAREGRSVFARLSHSGPGDLRAGPRRIMGRFLPVGGQAVIEGVMMRSPGRVATAVRRQDGGIVLQDKSFVSITRRFKPLAWPIVRGAAVLVEAMTLGVGSLTYAAEE